MWMNLHMSTQLLPDGWRCTIRKCISWFQSFEAELNNLQKQTQENIASASKASKTFAASGKVSASMRSGASVSHLDRLSELDSQPLDVTRKQAPVHALAINFKIRIEVTQGDITEESTDAIINSTDYRLDMSQYSLTLRRC